MGKIDDIQAYKEWTEYHRSLKRDKAADNLSPVERKKKLEKLEANVIEWILFFFSNSQSTPLPNSIKGHQTHHHEYGMVRGSIVVT